MLPAVLLLRPLGEAYDMHVLTTMPETCRGYWHSKHFPPRQPAGAFFGPKMILAALNNSAGSRRTL
jgi:hypothetical protein